MTEFRIVKIGDRILKVAIREAKAQLSDVHYTEPEIIRCPRCNSDDTSKYGIRKGVQEYICNKCHRKFHLGDAPLGMRTPVEQTAHALKDEPNPPTTRKNELLDKWHNKTLTYPESLELKGILEQQSSQADDTVKALIVIALVGLGLYILTHNQ